MSDRFITEYRGIALCFDGICYCVGKREPNRKTHYRYSAYFMRLYDALEEMGDIAIKNHLTRAGAGLRGLKMASVQRVVTLELENHRKWIKKHITSLPR